MPMDVWAWVWGKHCYSSGEVAYHSNNHEIVRRLLQVPGIDVNHKIGDLKWTAMHFAARFGYKCCEELAMCPEVNWNSINF